MYRVDFPLDWLLTEGPGGSSGQYGGIELPVTFPPPGTPHDLPNAWDPHHPLATWAPHDLPPPRMPARPFSLRHCFSVGDSLEAPGPALERVVPNLELETPSKFHSQKKFVNLPLKEAQF